MKKALLILIGFLILLNADLFSKQSLRTNFDILDSLINDYSNQIINELKKKNIQIAYLKVSTHSASELVYKHFLANSNSIEFSFKQSENLISVNNIISKANVKYVDYPNNNDSVYRIIEVDISTIASYPEGATVSINPVPQTYSELISRDDIKLIDSKEFTYTTAEVPERKLTFYEKIAEPLIIVTTAILTVVLLFTIRSG